LIGEKKYFFEASGSNTDERSLDAPFIGRICGDWIRSGEKEIHLLLF